MLTRRKFVAITALSTASTIGAVRLAQAAPRQVRLTRHRVSWPSQAGLRVAHLTDLHVGRATPGRHLEQSLVLCRDAEPDLVVLTGDYLNRGLRYLPELCRFVARLPRPCVATLGNHDYWSGAPEIEAALEQRGIMVLRNENRMLRVGTRLVPLVGIDDGVTGRDDVPRAFAGLSCPERALVLSHDPDTAEQVASHGGRLVLAGHTHGGQLAIPGLTPALARLAGHAHLAGWHTLGNTRLYVNAGIGSAVVRLRLGERAQPEVAVIECGR